MTEPQAHLHAVEDRARFTAGNETTDNTTTPPGGGAVSNSRQGKSRPELPLPTDRLGFDNQVEVLKQVASMSGNNRRGVNAETMSAAIGLRGGTGGLNSRFFRAANWFEAVGRGEYTASEGLLAYWRYINVDPDDRRSATTGMRSEVQRSWFWEVLSPMLESGHAVREKALLLQLANAANAADHKPQLEFVIDWLVWVGLVRRDGENVVLVDGAEPTDRVEAESTETEVDSVDEGTGVETVEPLAASQSVDEQEVPREIADDAIISFNVSVRLTAEDVRNLNDEQMTFVMALAEKLRG